MKKVIKKEGIVRGEVSISPQSQTSYGKNIWELPEKDVPEEEEINSSVSKIHKSFQVSASIGSTSFLAIHHIPEDKILEVAEWVEGKVHEFLEAFDTGESIEYQLSALGYSI